MSTFDLAVLLLRLAVGLTFAAHGAQKAFGWWGGPGMERWRGAIAGMGFRPAEPFAYLSVAAELLGGLLLAVGLVTPFAAAVLVAQSVVIIFHAHWAKGFWNREGGYEFPLVLAAAVVAVGLVGAGAISVDSVARLAWSDTVRIALVVIGLAAGLVSYAVPRVLAREETAASH
jgi:putative oxidoreductase